MAKKIKAIALLSGGLDSILAAKLVMEQGIEIIGFNFSSCLFQKSEKEKSPAEKAAAQLGIKCITLSNEQAYFQMLRRPKHGYGSGINACIDCKIFILKEAKKLAKKTGAKFIITGEVLGQRPMSQHSAALRAIEKESGLEGKLLRPLSAKLLPETEAEKKAWVKREGLLAIHGRSVKPQLELAKKLSITEFSSHAGGCLLTAQEFAARLGDFFKNNKSVSVRDIEILKIGRHFRFEKNKIICGRDKSENEKLLALKHKSDFVFEVPNIGSPIVLLQGPKTKKAICIAAQIALHYSDCKDAEAKVEFWLNKKKKKICVKQISHEEIEKIRI